MKVSTTASTISILSTGDSEILRNLKKAREMCLGISTHSEGGEEFSADRAGGRKWTERPSWGLFGPNKPWWAVRWGTLESKFLSLVKTWESGAKPCLYFTTRFFSACCQNLEDKQLSDMSGPSLLVSPSICEFSLLLCGHYFPYFCKKLIKNGKK